MNGFEEILAELARLRSSSEPIVSLYLDVRWGDEHQRDRVRLFVQERVREVLGRYLPGSPGREELEHTLERIRGYVAGLTGQAYAVQRSGLALFACESIGLWRPFLFGRPFENELETDWIPHLSKLARLAEDMPPAIVVVPNQTGADIYRVQLGDLEIETSLVGYLPRKDEGTFKPAKATVPGWHYEREDKNARHVDDFVSRNRKAAATQVAHLFDHRRGSKVVLVGPAAAVAAFERELPDRVRDEIVARVPRPRGWESGDGARRGGVKALAEQVLARKRRDEGAAVNAVVGHAMRGGLAVLGPDDVVLAANEGRVHTLVIEEDFERAGYRCENCGALGSNAEAAEVCPFCEGDLRVVHDLGEALVARALANGGRAEIVPHENKLHSYRGVAAFLRQTSATGLRGAIPPPPEPRGAQP